MTDHRHRWVAYAAAGWALIFAVFHLVWASGWYVGLDPDEARDAFAKPAFMAYDLVVAGMCVVAVPLALALALPWGRRLPRRLINILAWVGTVLLVLRAIGSLVQASYLLIVGRFDLREMGVWEPWFYIGAVLFSINLWWYWRTHAKQGRASPPPR